MKKLTFLLIMALSYSSFANDVSVNFRVKETDYKTKSGNLVYNAKIYGYSLKNRRYLDKEISKVTNKKLKRFCQSETGFNDVAVEIIERESEKSKTLNEVCFLNFFCGVNSYQEDLKINFICNDNK